MLVNNNPTPWVILALIILTMCALFGGVIVWADPLGPGQPARATQAAINARATESAFGPIQTATAISIGNAVVVANLTAMPPAQTATAIVVAENLAALQQAATQTTIANAQYIGNLAVAATATSMANNTGTQNSTWMAGTTSVIIITTALCLWVVGHTIVSVLRARAQHKIAHAQLLSEQRQLAEFRASHQKSPRPVVQPSIPVSLMKQRGNGHERSSAE